MWRITKAISQILVIALGLWGGLTGAINPTVAFVGVIVAYLGAEGVETVLAAAGQSQLEQLRNADGVQVEITNADDGEQPNPEQGRD